MGWRHPFPDDPLHESYAGCERFFILPTRVRSAHILSGQSIPSKPRPVPSTRAVTSHRTSRELRTICAIGLEYRTRFVEDVKSDRQIIEVIREKIRAKILEHQGNDLAKLKQFDCQRAFLRSFEQSGVSGASNAPSSLRKIERMRT